mmetsp:Transcript_31304/g.43394  ORF Transcript_31304/g.43394 Transcript_31304/m.43394 type:complete len:184 (+) Transcript_31304:45-596(+)
MESLASTCSTCIFITRNKNGQFANVNRVPNRVRGRKPATVKCAGLIDLPPSYGLVALTAASSYALVQWQAIKVSIARREFDVKYPTMYEDDEDSVFNCYQRAHQNTLESYPAFLALLCLGGIGYPLISSASGAVWIVGRIFYSLGYYTGDPQKRFNGIWNNFGLLTLWVCTILFAFKQLDVIP